MGRRQGGQRLSGQGPGGAGAGRSIAVGLLSFSKERGAAALPPTSKSPKKSRFTVFFPAPIFSNFSDLVA